MGEYGATINRFYSLIFNRRVALMRILWNNSVVEFWNSCINSNIFLFGGCMVE